MAASPPKGALVDDHYFEPFLVGTGSGLTCIHCGRGREVHHLVR